MSVLHDLSQPALEAANQANIVAQMPVMAQLRLEGVEIHDGPDVRWSITGLAHPFFNGVMDARFLPTEAEARIEATLDRFRARDLPLSWWVFPASTPVDLGDRLQAHGLDHVSDALGMAVDLRALNEDVRAPLGLEIERVSDVEALKGWIYPMATCFGFPDFGTDFMLDAYARIGFDPVSPWSHYLGRLEGEPIACSSLFIGAGVAGVYNVATLPEARRQGIGTALTLAALRAGRERGYRVGVLQASDLGAGVYRRLGFAEVCSFGMYLWSGEGTSSPARKG
jgi:ribosomal protein S18 acetylase RimI-like enzyme